MSSWWVRVDGVAGYAIGVHGAPTWDTLADGGCGAASVNFSTPSRVPNGALRKGVLFEILYGLQPVYTGMVTEFDRLSGDLHAKGLGQALYDFLALDGLGANTRTIGTALEQAIVRGWRGSNTYGITGVVLGEADGNPARIGDLAQQYAEQTGQWWGSDESGRFYLRGVPLEPDWITTPDAAAFGETSDDSPTRLAGRYVDASGVDRTAYAGTPGREDSVDLTDRLALTEAEAQEILTGQLARKSSTAWVNAVDLTADQITTLGGSPAFLPQVRAGQLMRSFGVGYLDRGALSLDTVIGKTTYTAGASTIRLEPVNTVPRDAIAVWAAS